MKENMYRDIYCGEVNSSYIGKNIRLAGWVNSIRNLGNLVFITLRDETGIVQLISEDVEKYKNLHREATVTVTGVVEARTPDMVNKNMKTGEIEVRQIFKFSKVGVIAGSHVTDGVIKANSKARLIRDGIVIYDGKIASLQREKDKVNEVKKGIECGITLENFGDIKEKDIIEAYEIVLKK